MLRDWVRRTFRTCKVHRRDLHRGEARVRYGQRVTFPDDDAAYAKLFPHANTVHEGGRRLRPYTSADVWFCPDCRAVEAKWLQSHPYYGDPRNAGVDPGGVTGRES